MLVDPFLGCELALRDGFTLYAEQTPQGNIRVGLYHDTRATVDQHIEWLTQQIPASYSVEMPLFNAAIDAIGKEYLLSYTCSARLPSLSFSQVEASEDLVSRLLTGGRIFVAQANRVIQEDARRFVNAYLTLSSHHNAQALGRTFREACTGLMDKLKQEIHPAKK